jgi:hypothetical protein
MAAEAWDNDKYPAAKTTRNRDDNTQDLDRPQPRQLGADDPARLPSQDRRE